MAIVGSRVSQKYGGANASSYTISIATPSANQMVMLWFAAHSAITQGFTSATGVMSAWTLLSRVSQWGANLKQFDALWAMQGTAPSGSIVTITTAGTQSDGLMIVDKWSGVSSEAPFQSVQSTVLSAANLAMLLSALGAGSSSAGAAGRGLNSATTGSTDFAFLGSINGNSPADNLGSEWTSANRSSVTVFVASAGSMAGVAIELRPAPAGAAIFSPYYHGYYRRLVVA